MKPGFTNNPNGRPKGTPNKITQDLRKRIDLFLSKNWKQVEIDFKAMEPAQRVLFFEKLIKYVLPTQANITTDIDKLSNEQVEALYSQIMENLKANENANG